MKDKDGVWEAEVTPEDGVNDVTIYGFISIVLIQAVRRNLATIPCHHTSFISINARLAEFIKSYLESYYRVYNSQ